MKTEEVKQLLEDFYNGETVVEQEQLLVHYFENESIPEKLQKDKEIFLQFYQSNPLLECAHLEIKLSQLINQLAKEETAAKRQIWLWAGSVAACFLLLVSSGLLLRNRDKETVASVQHIQYKDTFNDPEEAAIEAQKALTLFSDNYNKGIELLSMAAGNINKTNEIIRKTLK